MRAPQINEHWHVQYGLSIKTNIIVRIDEDKKEFTPINWRCNSFKCDRNGSELIVKGECFIEQFD